MSEEYKQIPGHWRTMIEMASIKSRMNCAIASLGLMFSDQG
jgi:hypothetical protein